MNREELIFNMYKDTSIGCKKLKNILYKKFGILDDEISTRIYTKINNYQIEKYGARIGSDIETLSRDECIRRQRIRKQCRYERLHYKRKRTR